MSVGMLKGGASSRVSPEFIVVGDCVKTFAYLTDSTQVLLQQVAKYCQQDFIRQLVLKVVSGRVTTARYS